MPAAGMTAGIDTVIRYSFIASYAAAANLSPQDYLAAAGLADMVSNILIIPPLAFNQSLNALVSQAMGSGNKKMAGTWLQCSLMWLTITYLPVLVSFFYVSPMLHFLGFSQELCDLAGTYAKFNAFWPIPNGWYQCMRFYFQAQTITKPAMYNNMFFLGVNALLNWIFVFGGPFHTLIGWQGFGFVGAAISLSCSRCSQPLLYWLYMFCWRKAHIDTWPSWGSKTFLKREHVRSFMAMSLPQVGTLIFQAVIGQTTTLMIAKLGKTAIAASAAAMAATQPALSGLSPTLSAVGGMRVGFYLGKGEPLHAYHSAKLSLGLGAAITGILAALILPCGHLVMSLVTDNASLQEAAIGILPAVLLNTFASIVVSVGTQGILTSQGRTKAVTVLSMAFELPLSIGSTAFFVFVLHAKLRAVYWAQAIVTMIEAVVVGIMVRRSDWEAHAREAQQRQSDASQGEHPEGDQESGDGLPTSISASLQPVREKVEERQVKLADDSTAPHAVRDEPARGA
eukprot:gnl/TRDRNA2_/TRDRNA2_162666_c0_seq3.p1 gnl/TRDRNA2_/TRDRNA2_162666_c0~~gnl/TRDRNA2_/TRDRNA2_162666_c0_seq3.p1  ORF type:complete len:600 (+),score=73.29 gnl/TRDRNA2_/TRDRNA2_162666_c0_seq3:273-1802(+)